MKSLEFSNMSVVDPASTQASSSSGADQAKTLETLLLEKNRALQTENTQLKVANNDLNGYCFIIWTHLPLDCCADTWLSSDWWGC